MTEQETAVQSDSPRRGRPTGAERANRPKRKPMGQRQILTADARPGYQRRWINDKDGRLLQAQDGGYNFVYDHKANTSDVNVSPDPKDGAVRKSVGGGMTAYLMEIPMEFHLEDQATGQREVDMSTEALMKPSNMKNTYGSIETERAGKTRTVRGDFE